MSKVDGIVGVPFTEENNYKQGKSADAATPRTPGPAVGNVSGNAAKSGGINRATTGLGAGKSAPAGSRF